MRPLPLRLELPIVDDDVDDDWQIRDLDAVMAPHRGQLRAIDETMVDALADDQAA